MVRNRMMTAMAVTTALAAGLFASQARATAIFTNTGTGNYLNEAGQLMLTVTATANFTGQSNPALAIVKTSAPIAGPSGTIVTWHMRVSYPRIADAALVCGDDSKAKTVVISDVVPIGFTYIAATIKVSADDGVTFGAAGTDAADGVDASGYDVSLVTNTVAAKLGDLVEGQGDTVNCGSQPKALVVEFKATKN